MLHPIFTVDYEIHGTGDGCPRELMVEPTSRLLRVLDEYGAKLTIMADVAEILRFKEYKDKIGHDKYHYEAIAQQLRQAVESGHDVQLHIHSSYFNATLENDRWVQDWTEYNFTGLPYARMEWMIRTCKDYLETLLRPVDPGYSCVAFRAANWSASPSQNLVRALASNGIQIDTSVFKYGRRAGIVNFDYSHAFSPLLPWRASDEDICRRDAGGSLWELPIYSEKRWVGAFLTPGRLHRVIAGLGHSVSRESRPRREPDGTGAGTKAPKASRLRTLFRKHAWKADFNQCYGWQLIRALHRACAFDTPAQGVSIPFVLIGHSKLFTEVNERSLRPFLSHVKKHSDRFGFDTLSGISRSQGNWNSI